MKYFPYEFTYRVEDKVYFCMYARTRKGQQVFIKYPMQPYFFAQTDTDLTKVSTDEAKVTQVKKVTRIINQSKVELLQIYVNFPKAVPVIAKSLEDQGITCYERDILFVHLCLRELNIIPMQGIDVEYTVPDQAHPNTLLATKVTPCPDNTEFNILAVDIETYAATSEIDQKKNPILMIAVYSKDIQKVFTWKEFKEKQTFVEVLKDEAAMLKAFESFVKGYQPDIITGYYSDGFDLPYIKTRAEILNTTCTLGEGPLKIRNNEVKVQGILHLDILKFIRYIFGRNLKTDSYSLNNVAQELLGATKDDVDITALAKAWDKTQGLAAFTAYNLQDTKLTWDLCNLLLPDIITFCQLLGLPPFEVSRMQFSRLVESYIMKEAKSRDIIFPNRPPGTERARRMDEHIQGGFVFEPTPGLYKDIVVFDFSSLYPTIISAHNIGPSSYRCSCCTEKVPGDANNWFCTKKRAFLPGVIDNIIQARSAVKAQLKIKKTPILQARSYALKILANAFYGYLGYFGARWYCLPAAAATTAYARHYIKNTIAQAKKAGFAVIYADTDSCFILLQDKNMDDATNFMNAINKKLPGQMELEFEGLFSSGIFVAARDSTRGAKKKYALRAADGTLKITGFEAVRRNLSLLARETQATVLNLVLQGQQDHAFKHVQTVIKQLEKGKIDPKKLVLTTKLTKPIKQYSNIGPHVHVAKILAKRGTPVLTGNSVRYVITAGTGLVRERAQPAQDVIKNYDSKYYLHKQLLPGIIPIFEVLGISQDAILGKSEQQGLGNFL